MGFSFEDLAAAAAFAESGEQGMAMDYLRTGGRILLAVTDETLNRRLVNYAVNLCGNTGSELDALYVAGPLTKHKEVEEKVAMLEAAGARMVVVRRDEELKEAILYYTSRRTKIKFVVLGGEGALCAAHDKGLFQRTIESMNCPLVVVTDGTEPSAA